MVTIWIVIGMVSLIGVGVFLYEMMGDDEIW